MKKRIRQESKATCTAAWATVTHYTSVISFTVFNSFIEIGLKKFCRVQLSLFNKDPANGTFICREYSAKFWGTDINLIGIWQKMMSKKIWLHSFTAVA